jgi:hypothetical protein
MTSGAAAVKVFLEPDTSTVTHIARDPVTNLCAIVEAHFGTLLEPSPGSSPTALRGPGHAA